MSVMYVYIASLLASVQCLVLLRHTRCVLMIFSSAATEEPRTTGIPADVPTQTQTHTQHHTHTHTHTDTHTHTHTHTLGDTEIREQMLECGMQVIEPAVCSIDSTLS